MLLCWGQIVALRLMTGVSGPVSRPPRRLGWPAPCELEPHHALRFKRERTDQCEADLAIISAELATGSARRA